MAIISAPNCATLTLPIASTSIRASFKPLHVSTSLAIRFAGDGLAGDGQTKRGLSLVTRAGPSTTSYVFAFVFPMSLLIATVITSIKIADKLDRDYLEELAINQAIREAGEEDDDAIDIPTEEEVKQPALQDTRTRNRPKREA